MNLLKRLRSPRASDWQALFRTGRAGAQDDQAWREWHESDAQNKSDYEAAELVWEASGDLRDRPAVQAWLREIDAQSGSAVRTGRGTRGGLPWWWLATAACMVVAVGAVFLLRQERAEISEYSTAVGEQRKVTLPDGSVVTLNTATHLRVNFTSGRRHIEMLAGEAYFFVGKDAARPFDVQAYRGLTTATGTQFDVWLASDGVSVNVLEGSVTVAGDATEAAGAVRLSSGQTVVYSPAGSVSAVRASDDVRIRAWQAQRVVFSDVSLVDALREYNRYLRVPIVLRSPELATRHVSGVFRIGEEDAFLRALSQTLPLKVSRGETETVLEAR